MKQPRLDVRAALANPAARSLYGHLLNQEEPIRVRVARESLKLSIAQFGLAMRSLERHGLAQVRTIASDAELPGPKLQHTYIEATDLAREHGIGLANLAAPTPPPTQ